MIRVILVDDQIILRDSLKQIMEQDEEIKVVDLAANGMEALEVSKKHNPDVVVMDIRMPEVDGIEGVKLIKKELPNVKILMLTTFVDEENIYDALNYGADGYILKDIKPEELILAIKNVYKNMVTLNKDVYKSIINNSKTEDKIWIKNREFNLTPRELSIVNLIVDGKNNKEIASELFLTEGTVKNIVTGILDKVNLRDRTQLAIFAIKNKLV